MSTGTSPERVREHDGVGRHGVEPHGRRRRLSTETKAAFKTTEFFAYIAVLAGILIAGLVIKGGGAGNTDFLGADRVWLYATILTGAYMIARGLAKSGSREPYDDDR